MRCSTITYDVRYMSAVNPQLLIVPKEIYGLINILESTSRRIQKWYKETHEMSFLKYKDGLVMRIQGLSEALLSIISTFNSSCHTFLLFELAVSCIMDMVELAIKVNMHGINQRMISYNHQGISNIHDLLKVFLSEHVNLPLPRRPVRLDVIKKYLDSRNNDTWALYECHHIFILFF